MGYGGTLTYPVSYTHLVQIIPAKSEIFAGETVALDIQGVMPDGRKVAAESLKLSVASSNANVATVSGQMLKAEMVGETNITVTAEMNGVTVTGSLSLIHIRCV